MLFSIDKCGVVHFGYSTKDQCVLNNQELKELTVDRNLRVLIQSDLSVSQLYRRAENKGNSVLGIINHSFTLKCQSIGLPCTSSGKSGPTLAGTENRLVM